MTQPPEYVEHRTETQQLEDAIVRACRAITTDWPDMIRDGETQPAGAHATTGVLLDDHDPRDADQRRIDRTISLRRYTQDQLNAWSRLIIEDRPVTNTATIPTGTDVPGMANFIQRHANWLSGHETAPDCRDELAALARRCHQIAHPTRREWVNLGACPLEVEFDPDQGVETCGGQVRAWPRAEDRDGEVMARCRRCGTEAIPMWWHSQMAGHIDDSPLVTATELIGVIAIVLDWTVTHVQIRKWKERGKITSRFKDAKGRSLFAHAEVIEAIKADIDVQREKVST